MISSWFERWWPRRPAPGTATAAGTRVPSLAAVGRTALFEHLDADARARLGRLMQRFLDEKHVIGARGYEPHERLRWQLAAQACLPVLELGLDAYGRFVDVIIYPDAFIAPRTRIDESGILTEWEDVLSGESMSAGPVVLSAPGITPPLPGERECLVIHEFAHKLDERFGISDSPDAQGHGPVAQLARALGEVHEDFVARLERLERDMPPTLDPESEEADAWYAGLPLDPYAATDPAECLAVAVEAFFCASPALGQAYPGLVEAFARFFGQRPMAADVTAAAGTRPETGPPPISSTIVGQTRTD